METLALREGGRLNINGMYIFRGLHLYMFSKFLNLWIKKYISDFRFIQKLD